jgi:hypothetical protein
MMQPPLTDPGASALLENFHSLEKLFDGRGRENEDLSLCFLCLRWTTGDEGCRRGDRCDLQLRLAQPDAITRN